MKAKGRCLKLVLLIVALSTFWFFYIGDADKNKALELEASIDSKIQSDGIKKSSFISGELRARLVKERCKEFPELKTCLYPSRGVHKRMLPVEDKKFALCVMGKTGSSNWKTLILQMRGLITEEEAKNMTYPHSKEYWEDGGTVYYYREPERNSKRMVRTINDEYYKITFVRDPLSRLFSGYRDKFTGTSDDHSFKVYRTKRAIEMCSCMEELMVTRPDGDIVPKEIYSFMEQEVERHCKKGEEFVTLGIFFLIAIFMPQDFKGDVLKDLTVNTHFNDMLSMCDHCRINYDFIGTVETMDSDFEFLKKKLGIEYDLPQIASTQTGVMSKGEVQTMWQNLPYILKQYVYLWLGNDATAFGYTGYDVDIDKKLLPSHYERRTNCNKFFNE